MKKVLLIVDPQIDFISGSLSVQSASSKMQSLTDYLENNPDEYDWIYLTADCHPKNHSSFVDFGGQWPAHCVNKTKGAKFYKPLMDVLSSKEYRNKFSVAYKGCSVDKDEYSVFSLDSERNITNSGGYTLYNELYDDLNERDIEFIEVCGIAGDFCVFNTLVDLMKLISKEHIVVREEFCASIDGGEKLSDLCYYNKLKTSLK